MRPASHISLRRLALFGCLAATAVAVSACGGSSGGSSSSDTAAATTTGSGSASLAAGKKVFAANCGNCHTLADAGTNGAVGPNLDDLEPDAALVAKQVENGGGGMPAFGSQLSAMEIQAVAKYVSSVAG
jgi:mono/diheme cytochrome c family protein